jgi:hypothetical protein
MVLQEAWQRMPTMPCPMGCSLTVYCSSAPRCWSPLVAHFSPGYYPVPPHFMMQHMMQMQMMPLPPGLAPGVGPYGPPGLAPPGATVVPTAVPGASAAQPPAADDWMEAKAPDGRHFYVSKILNQTSWIAPASFKPLVRLISHPVIADVSAVAEEEGCAQVLGADSRLGVAQGADRRRRDRLLPSRHKADELLAAAWRDLASLYEFVRCGSIRC